MAKRKQATETESPPEAATTPAAPAALSTSPSEGMDTAGGGCGCTSPQLPPIVRSGDGEKQRPAHTITVPAGPGAYIEVSMWPRVIPLDGKEMTVYNATFRKSYKANGGWENTSYVRGSELHLVEYLARRASEWILAQRTNDSPF